MRRLDKLIKRAGAIAPVVAPVGVHILEGEYCYSCMGKCKYLHDESLERVIFNGPPIITVISTPDGNNGYNDATVAVLKVMADYTGGEYL